MTEKELRTFDSGATRNSDAGKYDIVGHLSPRVLMAYVDYLHKKRPQLDGSIREADNWKFGIPRDELLKSAARHFFDLWCIEETGTAVRPEDGHIVDIEEALGGLLFNVMAIWDSELYEDGMDRYSS